MKKLMLILKNINRIPELVDKERQLHEVNKLIKSAGIGAVKVPNEIIDDLWKSSGIITKKS